MRRFRKIDNGHLGRWDRTLQKWGYPRRLSENEWGRDTSVYLYGDDCIIWLERVIGEWRTAILHMVVDPKTQKRHGIAARRFFQGLDILADLNYIDRLIANDCTESGEVTDYLKRLGWKPCTMETIEGEWYERSFVDGKAEKDSHEQASETEDRPSESGRGPGGQDRSDRERAQESRSAAGPGRERIRTP